MHTDRCGNTSGQKCHTKEAENKLKYKSLCVEIQRMWNMKCVIYTRGNCSHRNSNKRFKQSLESIPGKREIDSLQKTAVLGTSHNTECIAV
jgi:hypothetical protein